MAKKEIHTIPLRKVKDVPRKKRAIKAVKIVKEFLARHMNAEIEDILLNNTINEEIWRKGITKPPSKIRVKATRKDDGMIEAVLAEE